MKAEDRREKKVFDHKLSSCNYLLSSRIFLEQNVIQYGTPRLIISKILTYDECILLDILLY